MFSGDNEKRNLIGYVLSVSPVKIAKRTNKQYFAMDLETESDIKNVICFSPSKRRLFNDAAVQRTGCKIKKVTQKADESTVFQITLLYMKKSWDFPVPTYMNMHLYRML